MPDAPSALSCGSNDVSCSSNHVSDPAVCTALIGELSNDPNHFLGNSPRSVCVEEFDVVCCISWSVAVRVLPKGDLTNAANKISSACKGSSISGLARNVNLNGQCVTECLSNHHDGCS